MSERKFNTIGGGWKPFGRAVIVKGTDGKEHRITHEVLAKNKTHAENLIVAKLNKDYGSANWRWA